MNPNTLNLIMWLPFLVAVVITGLIFMIGGYKKGLRRALLSLAATVVGAVLSVLLAKVIAPIVTPEVVKSIPAESLFGDDIPINLVNMFMESIIQVVVTQVLFFLLLIFLTTICRILFGYFFGQKKEKSEEDEDVVVPVKASKKWGGLGIGFANAMLFSLLLVLPLYGTIAAYVPAITKMYSLSASASGSDSNASSEGTGSTGNVGGSAQTEDELLALLNGLSSHPAVLISGSGPVADAYDALSETKLNNTTVNYSKMADTMEDVITKVEAISAVETPEDFEKHSKELLTVLKEDVMEEEWAYDLVVEVKDSLRDYMPEMDDESYAVIDQVLDNICSSKENFKEVGTKVLDAVIKTLDSTESNEEKEEDLMKILADVLEGIELE